MSRFYEPEFWDIVAVKWLASIMVREWKHAAEFLEENLGNFPMLGFFPHSYSGFNAVLLTFCPVFPTVSRLYIWRVGHILVVKLSYSRLQGEGFSSRKVIPHSNLCLDQSFSEHMYARVGQGFLRKV